MILKSLEIQGFKSFPDRIKVDITPGITAVVGPNGSGKSNISDAIRWVLGETSSKQLRGSGKMEDVIFGGTGRRSPMGFASVKLYMDNHDRSLAVDSDEVVLGRRYYRSGESEYSLNGKPCRLKDIYELLLDTGLGRDGYSIIGQGRISEIVSAKSNERREIFEEAAGIAHFRFRKNEAESSLNAAQNNLVRIHDIVAELEAQVGPLKRDSEKAERFIKLAAERRELEVTYWSELIRRGEDTVREHQRKIEIAQNDCQNLENERQALEQKGETLRMQSEELIVANERCSKEISSINEEISLLESENAVHETNLARNKEDIIKNNARLQLSLSGDQDILSQIENAGEQIQAIQEHLTQVENKGKEISRQMDQLKEEGRVSDSLLSEKQQAAENLSDEYTAEKIRCASSQAEQQSAKEKAENLIQDKSTNHVLLEKYRETVERVTADIEKGNASLQKSKNIAEGLRLKNDSLTRKLQSCHEQTQKAFEEHARCLQRFDMLKEMEKNMDGYHYGVKRVMQAAQGGRLKGVVAPISELITVKAGYETAIETALGGAIQNIVVDTFQNAKNVLAFVRSEKAGRVSCSPLETTQNREMDGSRLRVGIPAMQVVSFDARYANVIGNVLGNIVITDDMDQAYQEARNLNFKNRIVTLDGQQMNPGGTLTGGSVAKSVGAFGRRAEIEKLKEKESKLRESLALAEETENKLKGDSEKIAAQLTAVESEQANLRQQLAVLGAEYSAAKDSLQRCEETENQLEARHGELLKQAEDAAANLTESTKRLQELEEQIARSREALQQINSEAEKHLERLNDLNEQFSRNELEKLSAEKDLDHQRELITELQQRCSRGEDDRKQIRVDIEKLEEENQTLSLQVENNRLICNEKRDAIVQKEQEKTTNTDLRMQLDAAMTENRTKERETEEKLQAMNAELARLSERKSSAEADCAQTEAKLWEEYELTAQEAVRICVPFESFSELSRRVTEIRNRIKALGSVNLESIDRYAEVSQRYETLKAQAADVEKSRNELLKLIRELSGEMEQIFNRNFAEINGNFGRIFTELFGGGSASLKLTEPDNVLESGIEINVAPPGKVIKNLSALSGGEKALVAICIYFAILAVRPSPFCVLDEIEAALDDVNVTRYAQYLRRINDKTQFILITHRRGTMEAADVMYGITMQEDGVSKVLRLDLNSMDASVVRE